MSIPQPQSGVPSSVAENKPVDDFRPIPEDQLTDAPIAQEPAVDETPPSPPVAQEQLVSNDPKVENPQAANFEAFRNEIKEKISKIDELEKARLSERQLYEQELALLKSQLPQRVQEDRKEGPFKEFEDDYVPTVRELRQAFTEHEKSLRDKIDELETMHAYPDYQKVLQEDLLPFIKDKPHFVQMIAQAPNKAKAAYELGMMARQVKAPAASPPGAPVQQQPQGTPPSEIAQRIVDNANKPISLANAGGIGSPLSKADYYASMSDADFARLAKQNLANL